MNNICKTATGTLLLWKDVGCPKAWKVPLFLVTIHFTALLKAAFSISLFLLFLSQPTSAQADNQLRLPAEQRICATYSFLWSLPIENPVFQKSVDSICRLAKAEGDERLSLYTRLIAAERKTAIMKGKPLAETPLFQLKSVMEAAPYPDVKASYSYYLFVYHEMNHDNSHAFPHLISAVETFDKIGWRNVPLAFIIAAYLFETYYHYEDYPTAIRFAKIALENTDGGTFRPTHLLSNMGEAYLKLKDMARAQSLFTQVLQLAKETSDTAYIGIANGNYGNSLRLQGRYREALPYFYTEVALNEKRVPENSAINCAYIAQCLLHLDSVEKAGRYLQQAYRLKIDYYWSWAPFHLAYYQTAALYHKRRGEYFQASLYQDSLLSVKDSLRERFNNTILLTTSLTLKEQKRLAEKEQQELKAANLRLVRNGIIGVLVTVFTAVLVVVHRRQQQMKAQFLARQRQAEEKLQQAEKDLAQYLVVIREKNRLLEQIEAQQPVRHKDGGPGGAEPEVPTAAHLTLLTEGDWQKFKALFSAAYPDFLPNLERRYPGLSPAETRLLALQKLQLSSKETAAVLGISPESLRKSRYRLRKRYPELQLDDENRNPNEGPANLP